MVEISEWELRLVREAQAGSLSAFDELARRLRPHLGLRAITWLPKDARDDVAQQALLVAYKALPSLREPERFLSWLRAIARAQAHRWLESERKTKSALDELLLRNLPHVAAPSADRLALHQELARLPPDLRSVVEMHYFDEHSVAEIAASLGISTEATKWRLWRSRKLLGDRWQPEIKSNEK
jgi:RNA polymerase sigma-70 factor (ECF subfamily)